MGRRPESAKMESFSVRYFPQDDVSNRNKTHPWFLKKGLFSHFSGLWSTGKPCLKNNNLSMPRTPFGFLAKKMATPKPKSSPRRVTTSLSRTWVPCR